MRSSCLTGLRELDAKFMSYRTTRGAMAVSSLRYRPNAPAPEENKHGYVVFENKPTEYS